MPHPAAPLSPSHSSVGAADPPALRWELALVLALGAALLGFGWTDTSAYLAGLKKPPIAFALTARPGGMRVGTAQEFYRRGEDTYVRLENFGGVEHNGSLSYRHGLGPVSTLEVFCPASSAKLGLRFDNLFPGQDLTVACNGQVLERIVQAPPGTLARVYPLALRPGSNVVTFTYRRYYHDGGPEMLPDSRPIAGTFLALDLLF